MDGYNVTIMAFGATGSGKSYLMAGNDQDPGIAPLVIQQLFQHMRQKSNKEFMVTASFVEVGAWAHAIFTITVEQKERQSSKVGDVKQLTVQIQKFWLDKSYQKTNSALQYATFARSIKNHVRMNLDDTQDTVAELRQEISRLRDKIAGSTEPSRDDVAKMEDLVSDLQLAKKQTWEEKERQSARFEEERKINLANKGILEWVMDSMKKGNRELQEKILLLQKERDQLEERKRMEQEHKAMVEEEMEQAKRDLENDMAEIQMREAEGHQYSTKEGAQLEKALAELKADKPVIAMKLQTLQQEKEHLVTELEGVYAMHKEQLELQQLQHYQTFRSYREMFEEQKAAIDQRYRHLLEDCIQDAVFLSSRNSELTAENQSLKQQIAEMKDVVTKLGGKIPSSVDAKN
nr:hypothetical protein BaRGS_023220 [Batillaria attramentaria]